MDIIYAFKEDIGNPHLFTGRIKLLDNFLEWVYFIRKEIGKSAFTKGPLNRSNS